MTQLVVSEVFTNTIQGEGPSAGKPATFLRLYGCPVHCNFCDTEYTWAEGTRGEAHAYDVGELAIELTRLYTETGIDRLVVTGGEPMAQAGAIGDLLDVLSVYKHIEVETSGIYVPLAGYPIHYNVSPKLRHANARIPYRLGILRTYVDVPSAFKFVVKTVGDFEEIGVIVETIHLPRERVWVMPEGTDEQAILWGARAIVAETVRNRYNLSLRAHVLLWGNERGR